MNPPPDTTMPPVVSPEQVRRQVFALADRRDQRVRESQELARAFAEVNGYLDIADDVSDALRDLNDQLLAETLGTVQQKLTIALQEILDQPVTFRATPQFKRNALSVEFSIERDGNTEDILRGQGGSVANILSVGLRMFALMTLDESAHRRFLVLDEQDCWLRPDLVPRLVKMVQEAGAALGFQVLMISHHDSSHFEQFADRIYRLGLNAAGAIEVEQVTTRAPHHDNHDTDT